MAAQSRFEALLVTVGIADKAAFATRQSTDPFLIAMGRADQRERLILS